MSNNTHKNEIKDGYFTKYLSTKAAYNRECKMCKYLRKMNVNGVVKLNSYDESEKMIQYEYVDGMSLEDKFGLCIIPDDQRDVIWERITHTLFAMHSYGAIHGDFKAKNIIIDDEMNCVLCDFDQSQISRNEESVRDDIKKLNTIHYQLYFTRPGDKHHWSYKNNDANYRHGEQIYMRGCEFDNDYKQYLKNRNKNREIDSEEWITNLKAIWKDL